MIHNTSLLSSNSNEVTLSVQQVLNGKLCMIGSYDDLFLIEIALISYVLCNHVSCLDQHSFIHNRKNSQSTHIEGSILFFQPTNISTMLLRIHRSANCQEVVGICDKELIGTTLTEGDVNILISPFFFGSHEASDEEVLNVLKDCSNINMFGERCISLAIKNGYIDQDSCRLIAGVPHAIIL